METTLSKKEKVKKERKLWLAVEEENLKNNMFEKIIKILEGKLNQGISFSCDIRLVERYLKLAWKMIKGAKKDEHKGNNGEHRNRRK